MVLPCFFERGACGSASEANSAVERPIIRKSGGEKTTWRLGHRSRGWFLHEQAELLGADVVAVAHFAAAA